MLPGTIKDVPMMSGRVACICAIQTISIRLSDECQRHSSLSAANDRVHEAIDPPCHAEAAATNAIALNNSRPPGSPPSTHPLSRATRRPESLLPACVPALFVRGLRPARSHTYMYGRCQAPFRPQSSRPCRRLAISIIYYRFRRSKHAIAYSGRLRAIAPACWGIHNDSSSRGEGGGMSVGPVAVPAMIIMLPNGRPTPEAPQCRSGSPEIGFDAPLTATDCSIII